jgi:hypothetical protein
MHENDPGLHIPDYTLKARSRSQQNLIGGGILAWESFEGLLPDTDTPA